MTELVVVIALIAIITAMGIPSMLTYLQAEELRGAAAEMAGRLHQARQLAITQNVQHCVELDAAGDRLRFHAMPGAVACLAGAPWVGPGTDALGWMTLENRATIVGTTGNPVFSPLGGATGATITVANSAGTQTLNVVVNSVGRIQIL